MIDAIKSIQRTKQRHANLQVMNMLWRRLLSACTQQQFFKPNTAFYLENVQLNCTIYITAQNALKVAILRYKIKKFSVEGALPLPRPLPQWGGGHPLPTPYPPRRLRRLDSRAYGARPPFSRLRRSTSAPSAPRLPLPVSLFRYFRPCNTDSNK